nr:3-oxo-tetronate kinase [Shimia sp. Alg240-R146]
MLLGAIADDFTGATDLANTLVKEGMRVVQIIGVPDASAAPENVDAVVVALKSRSAPVGEAVSQSLEALRWLQSRGAEQIVFKYCSTFDSTPEGNIGPVADALRAETGADCAIICPAFPENARTIYNGHLFVGDMPLHESSMKDHPLTPMRDSSLIRLMAAQSDAEVGLVPLQTVHEGADAVCNAIATLAAKGIGYAVVDALNDADLRVIGAAARDQRLVTGGSGVATGLPESFRSRGLLGAPAKASAPVVVGRELVLAGSCSAATRGQIARAKEAWPTRKIAVDRIAAGDDVVGELTDWALAQHDDAPVLIYASADPEEVQQVQAVYGVEKAGAMVEEVMGALAVRLTAAGFGRLVVAGGETSGAVVSALRVNALRIGPEIAPGVPWSESIGTQPLALALKSGNFGGPNFFEEAFAVVR